MREIDHGCFRLSTESGLALKMMDYVHPAEVVQDDRLDPAEKRAILSAWASDACAVEFRPGFRWLSGTPGPILVDHVLEALRALDDMTERKSAGTKAPVLRRPGHRGSAISLPDGRTLHCNAGPSR